MQQVRRRTDSEPREASPNALLLQLAHCLGLLLTRKEEFNAKSLRREIGEFIFEIYNKGLSKLKTLVVTALLLMRCAKQAPLLLAESSWNAALLGTLLLSEKLIYDQQAPTILGDQADPAAALRFEAQLALEPRVNRVVSRGQFVQFYMRLGEHKSRKERAGPELSAHASTQPSTSLLFR